MDFSSTDIFVTESFAHLNIAGCCQKYGNNESNAHEHRVKYSWVGCDGPTTFGSCQNDTHTHTLGSDIWSCGSLTEETGGQMSASTPLMSMLNEAFESMGLPSLRATEGVSILGVLCT